jgi:hypothetical protein
VADLLQYNDSLSPTHLPSLDFSALRSSLINSLSAVADLPLDVHPAYVRHAQLALEIFQGIEAVETGVDEGPEVELARGQVVELQPLTLEEISERVAASLKVPHASLMSPTRKQHIAFCRQVAMFVCRRLTKHSSPRIGEHFGRDHSTCLHNIAVIQTRIDQDPAFARTIENLERQIGGAVLIPLSAAA